MAKLTRLVPALCLAAIVLLGDGPPPVLWQGLAPGAEHLTLATEAGAVELLRFDLDQFRADVLAPGSDTPPSGLSAADARKQLGAAAVVNGGFFDERRRSLGLRIAAGDQRVALRRKVEWGVLLVRDRRAEIVHSVDYRPDAGVTAAIQVGPRILVAGELVKLKPQRARRTVVAVDRSGRFLTLIVSNAVVDANLLAAAIRPLGFASALMLDGGPSTQLSVSIGLLDLDLPGGYAVPDLLAIRRR